MNTKELSMCVQGKEWIREMKISMKARGIVLQFSSPLIW